MAELDCVRDGYRLRFGVNDCEAAVVVECGSNVVTVAAAEGPGGTVTGFRVDDDSASYGTQGSGCVVEGAAVEVGPCREVWGKRCLA